jgi:hypothetical protein
MINKCLIIHYVIIMLMIMIFKVVKCSLIEIVIGLSVVLSFYKEK